MQVRMEGGTGEKRRRCQKCESGVLVMRVGKYGEFLSCSRFPRCDYTEKFERHCPQCSDGKMIVKKGPYGRFLSCSRYPRCDYTENPNKPRARH
jgi:topoisomerase IA-like protein